MTSTEARSYKAAAAAHSELETETGAAAAAPMRLKRKRRRARDWSEAAAVVYIWCRAAGVGEALDANGRVELLSVSAIAIGWRATRRERARGGQAEAVRCGAAKEPRRREQQSHRADPDPALVVAQL